MPVGVVLIGKPGEEAKLLSYAYALEQATKLRVDPDVAKLIASESTSRLDRRNPIRPSLAVGAVRLYQHCQEHRRCSGLRLRDRPKSAGRAVLRWVTRPFNSPSRA